MVFFYKMWITFALDFLLLISVANGQSITPSETTPLPPETPMEPTSTDTLSSSVPETTFIPTTSLTPSPTVVPPPPVCPQEMVETAGINITWLQTDSGRTATAPCPNTAISATRNCSVNATWGEPFVCNCLLSSDSQQLCASNDNRSIVIALSNITTNGTPTAGDVTTAIELIQLITDDPAILSTPENRQVVLDSLDNVFSTPRDIAGNVQLANSIEQSITDGLNAVIDNTPVSPGGQVVVNSTQGNVQVVVSRPTVNTIRNQGIQVQGRDNSVNLPPGLLMEVLGNDLGGGNVTLSVVAVPNQPGTFQPVDSTFLLGSDLIEITLRENGRRVIVENLPPSNLVTFEVPRRQFRNGQPFCCFYNEILRRWTSEGCSVIAVSRTSATCACNHLTFFAFLTGPSSPSSITPLGAVLIAVGIFVALALIVTGCVMIAVICYHNRAKDKPVVLSSL